MYSVQPKTNKTYLVLGVRSSLLSVGSMYYVFTVYHVLYYILRIEHPHPKHFNIQQQQHFSNLLIFILLSIHGYTVSNGEDTDINNAREPGTRARTRAHLRKEIADA